MNNDKSFVRHEMLNLITLVDFQISEAPLKPKERSGITEKIKMIRMLCAHREFILGKKAKFLKRDLSVAELLELTQAILGNQVKKGSVRFNLPKKDLVVQADRDAVIRALEEIILSLMTLTKKIDIKLEPGKRKLSLRYDSDKTLKLSKLEIIESMRKGAEPIQLFFEIKVRLLNASGVKTNFKKGVVELLF